MLKKILVLLSLLYAAFAFAAVDANTASAADLDSVKGIGPGMSSRIIKERKKSEFKDWADFISRVKGVGEKNAAKFSAAGLTVNGAAYTAAAAASPAKPKAAPAAASSNTAAKTPAPSAPATAASKP
ncbi:MAG: helix-hairpin-helix domain-containing protein [Rubrivivax sp.]|uniref:ComEA family DNA-binding protein n=1 Tax=Ottowia sp. TaxID=1898956 RepID=UPI002177D480|nr:helix-hairpin-helix domain-containing protein [Ottowia sp.]MCC6813146.1 helix-hairpin-helix domain-containing protein [Rubrivivax sp.]MCZ2088080.1 helix-hairpin-helix domain-containing protein [Burkholderiales bacterium]HNE60230.1 helix-hairpin-helix domain-containing protein [Ottowia sp.]HNI85660.1 helix-hairpin-helix domain-containing protein [Ottowia sp.]HNJ46100.1 helix-hairpin-helix domain-containing protein [Ottowia sp.]